MPARMQPAQMGDDDDDGSSLTPEDRAMIAEVLRHGPPANDPEIAALVAQTMAEVRKARAVDVRKHAVVETRKMETPAEYTQRVMTLAANAAVDRALELLRRKNKSAFEEATRILEQREVGEAYFARIHGQR